MTQIALFPIPDCVAFPGTVFPLHVFEPRYRQMVHHCLDHAMPLGVCHIEKEIQQAPAGQSLAEALNSNQASYLPQAVFSAGPVELVDTLPDGRMAIEVHIESRYQRQAIMQHLPFMIAEAHLLADERLDETLEQYTRQLQTRVLTRLEALAAGQPSLKALLANRAWGELDATHFSLQIFGAIRFPGNIAQPVLETTRPDRRLEALLSILDRV